MAKYILKAFFLTTFPSTQKKCPKIYAVALVLPLKKNSKYLMVGSIPTLHLKTFDQRERFHGKIKEKCSGKRNHKIFATTVLFLFRSVTPVSRKLD